MTAGPSTPEGRYTVTLTGSDGTGSQTASVTTLVFVSDFQLSGSTNLPVPLGSSRNDTFQVISAWGFYGNISLTTAVSAPGLSAFLNTTHVSVTPFKFARVLLTVNTAGVQLGDYNVTITATSSPSTPGTALLNLTAGPSTPEGRYTVTLTGVLLIAFVLVDGLWIGKRGKASTYA